jgi:hypothetical protein
MKQARKRGLSDVPLRLESAKHVEDGLFPAVFDDLTVGEDHTIEVPARTHRESRGRGGIDRLGRGSRVWSQEVGQRSSADRLEGRGHGVSESVSRLTR